MRKVITVFRNQKEDSIKAENFLREKFDDKEFFITNELTKDTKIIMCIGGDGTLLEGVHKFDFPNIPFLGVNTGHLGFFQEIRPNQLEDFIDSYRKNQYTIQELSTLEATFKGEDSKDITIKGLNEIVVRSPKIAKPVHLCLSIDDTFMENFSGDGIAVSSSAGSTAYNYSLGGSILDPELDAIQLTPISPMNNKAYRSFTSSILLSANRVIKVAPDTPIWDNKQNIKISADNLEFEYQGVGTIHIKISNKKVKLLRFLNYNFWRKIKEKFL